MTSRSERHTRKDAVHSARIKVRVNDKMQRGYVYYRTEPVGRNFAAENSQLGRKLLLAPGVGVIDNMKELL